MSFLKNAMIIITLSTHSSSAFHRWKSNRPSFFLDDDQDWWDHLDGKSSPMFQAKDQWCYKQLQTVILYWLVVSTPLKIMSLSVGMIIPIIWKNKMRVPNHQAVSHGHFWGGQCPANAANACTEPHAMLGPKTPVPSFDCPELSLL